jgi:polysaccharide biosynthesis/export protein
MSTQRVWVFCAGLLMLFLLGAARESLAQGVLAGSSPAELNMLNPLEQLRMRLGTARPATMGLALEGPVNPAEYLLGPGDVFSVSVGGPAPTQFDASVSADGFLVIPGVASFKAAGMTLASAQEEAYSLLKQQFRYVPTEVALVQPRRFYVHVSGVVPEPNRYVATPASRMSDVLEMAYAAELPYLQAQGGAANPPLSASAERPSLQGEYRPSLRNVTLLRNGETHSLDLFRYFTMGDTEHNPYLQDGDVISVPAYHVQRDVVTVSGDVPYPGGFPYRPGDTVLDALLLAVGPQGMAGLDEVRLIRRDASGGAETRHIDIQAILAGTESFEPLRPGDRLDVPRTVRAMASAYGDVEYPGTYPIESGETTLRELVALAGGLKPDASVRTAYLERRKSLAAKENGNVSDLDFFSRTYLRQELDRNRVVIDLAAALRPGAAEFFLQDGDVIVFPRDEETVFVTGNVPQPGYVAFEPGRTADYYVGKTGGLGPQSTGIYVFEAGTGQVHKGPEVAVKSGDTIFIDRRAVPDSPEMAQLSLTQEAAERQSRILTTQTIITGISAITSIITAYIAVTR